MSIEIVTLIMFGGVLVGLILGLPLAWVLFGIAVLVNILTWGASGFTVMIMSIFGSMWNVIFISIPLFIFMGALLEKSGIADDLFESVYRWSGMVRGGLAIGTVVICALFAAMTGITGAATVTMGLIAVPAMLNRGYDKNLALGSVAAPGTLGILIPPSVSMVLLAVIGRLSVGKLFMAGVMPGLILTVLFIAYITIRCYLQPNISPTYSKQFTLKEKFLSLKSIVLPLLIILAVSGSIFAGIATPTEASAIGALAVIIATALHRKLSWGIIKAATHTTTRMTGMVIWIVFGAIAFTTTFTALGGVNFITDFVLDLEISPALIVFVIMFITFILGMFLDPTGLIFLIGPIGFQITNSLGYDPIWFAILFVICLQMGYITPPFGYNLFYLKTTAPEGISMADIYKSIIPFLLIMILGMLIVWLFPQITLWLPNAMIR